MGPKAFRLGSLAASVALDLSQSMVSFCIGKSGIRHVKNQVGFVWSAEHLCGLHDTHPCQKNGWRDQESRTFANKPQTSQLAPRTCQPV